MIILTAALILATAWLVYRTTQQPETRQSAIRVRQEPRKPRRTEIIDE